MHTPISFFNDINDIFITIAIALFLIGTIISVVCPKKPTIASSFFTFGYVFLIIASFTINKINFTLLLACLIINSIGMYKIVKNRKGEKL